MDRKIEVIDDGRIAASMIPSRRGMYKIIDDCRDVRRIDYILPSGSVKTLNNLEEHNSGMDYTHIKPNCPIDYLSVEFPSFRLKYGLDKKIHFDKWEWIFDFKKQKPDDERLLKVNTIINWVD